MQRTIKKKKAKRTAGSKENNGGTAASWVVKHVQKGKGGVHRRKMLMRRQNAPTWDLYAVLYRQQQKTNPRDYIWSGEGLRLRGLGEEGQRRVLYRKKSGRRDE